MICEEYSLFRSKVKVIAGPKFDEKYFLVNLADEMAHYLFRHVPNEELKRDNHRKYLITK